VRQYQVAKNIVNAPGAISTPGASFSFLYRHVAGNRHLAIEFHVI